MPEVNVQRLTLKIPEVFGTEAAALAQYVANGLARSALTTAAPGSVDHLQVRVPTGGERDARRVADWVVTQIMNELGRQQ